MTKPPHALLFPNGTGMFFDSHGKQITTLQPYGWRGVHYFHEMYPEAPVSVAYANPIDPQVLPYFLSNIKKVDDEL